jgi:hypothetical protein
MEKTHIKLSQLKLLHERNEAKKQELESTATTTQCEVIGLYNHMHAVEVRSRKHFKLRREN